MQDISVAQVGNHVTAAETRRQPLDTELLVVRLDGSATPNPHSLAALRRYPGVTVGIARGTPEGPLSAALDVLLTTTPSPPFGWVRVPDLEVATATLSDAVAASPIAARVCVDLLRHQGSRDADAGLMAESTAYSTLLAGPEFARWLRLRGPLAHRPGGGDPIRMEHRPEGVVVVLDRPHVRNALDRAMREALMDVLLALRHDGGDTPIVLTGAGSSFCTGGDLSEFGTAPDPATAHLLRTTPGPARLLDDLRERTVARVHGACVGAGVELPAFATRVEAAAGTTFRLPEVGMGLVPGAGGTVSLPRRIGTQRTTWLALAGVTLDTPTALAWGLVDSVT